MASWILALSLGCSSVAPPRPDVGAETGPTPDVQADLDAGTDAPGGDMALDAPPEIEASAPADAPTDSDVAVSTGENTVAACTDGRDNDGDTYVDCGDSNCCAVVDCSAQPTSYCGRRIADAGPGDSGVPCTRTFGHALTPVFGRLDGTVRAVVGPRDAPCLRDDNHAIVQIDMGGATYQMWVTLQSTLAVTDVRVSMFETAAPLVGPAWSDGWWTEGMSLDYAATLGAHTPAFVAMTADELVTALRTRLRPGDRVSVFATGYASMDGGHLVHYNGTMQDGAIVVSPDTAPRYLLFQFAKQSF